MKLTQDIVKALDRCISDGFESVAEFASMTNISARTLSKHLRQESTTIRSETWEKLYPLLQPYLNNRKESCFRMTGTNKPAELSTDERILLDAFADLPQEVRAEKLLEILTLAKKFNEEKKKAPEEE